MTALNFAYRNALTFSLQIKHTRISICFHVVTFPPLEAKVIEKHLTVFANGIARYALLARLNNPILPSITHNHYPFLTEPAASARGLS